MLGTTIFLHMPKRKAEDPVAVSSTMSLIFYRAPMSTAVITDAVFAELGTPHETVIVDIKVSSPPALGTALLRSRQTTAVLFKRPSP